MKRLIFTAAAALCCMIPIACNNVDNSRESSPNTGPEKQSLPSPERGNSGAVPATGESANTLGNSNAGTITNSFYATAARGGTAEVELSKAAQAKASNAEVKKFAQMMVADHTKANAELKSVAGKKNVDLPTDLATADRAALEELNGLSGAQFDRTYVDAMVDAHETDVQLFEDQAGDDTDPEAKAFAAKTLPTLRKHLETIKGIQSRLQ
jgi:putative membrane protein